MGVNTEDQGKLLKDLSDDVRELAIARLLGEKPLIDTAKFIIEVKEGQTFCEKCPFHALVEDENGYCGNSFDCLNCEDYDLTTMNIYKLE